MDYLNITKDAALCAGRVHKKYFKGDIRIRKKSSTFDLLTVADTESEKSAVSLIRRYSPGDNIIAEEKKYKRTGSKLTWIIDPLDGTTNFASGLPIFCSSVALAYEDEVVAGAVYDVTRDELFYAAKDTGAYLNGKRISVSRVSNLQQALMITGFYYSRGKEMVQTLEAIKKFHFKHIRGLRRLGAAALDLCYIACGRASGFWEFQLSPWDYSAGKLLIEEAGGVVSGKKGEEVPFAKKHYIVASSSENLHRQMLKVINTK